MTAANSCFKKVPTVCGFLPLSVGLFLERKSQQKELLRGGVAAAGRANSFCGTRCKDFAVIGALWG